MSRARLSAALAAFLLPLGIACHDPSAPAQGARPLGLPSLDLVITAIEVAVSAEEVALADKDGDNAICGKLTSSDNALLKDANAATPSQPCPAGWELLKTPKVTGTKGTYTEDKNANGLVCIKDLTNGKSIVKDDNTGTPSQPCPPAFLPYGKPPTGPKADAEDLQAADEDADHLVCVNAVASGNFIVRDDNNATPSQPCPAGWAAVNVGKGGDDPADPADPAEPAKP